MFPSFYIIVCRLIFLLYFERSPVRIIIRKCSFCKCFEVRKRLYNHHHDARRSDHIFKLSQLKEASEENKTDRDRSVDVKSIANEALRISERQPLECRLVSAA
ncbi:hypothetical protein IGI04_035409 [Brassica rapa subsp. trilocularis]|uniref:Uncharacterized protein n=1 Tax=Brassica rapa subsp. trilocularis TaxID=1813537 RepID=A0ABQ7LEE4_BRACM|nr:hypothetical protein IGI04_035409 [Brassica rapa subsp. trilocularis]